MNFYLLGLLWAVVAYVIYRLVATIIADRHHAAEAKRLGCQPAPIRKDSILGIGGVLRALRAQKDKTFPIMLREIYHEQSGATTWQYQALGNWAYFTVDPTVVKAVLATQFEDFGHGLVRRDCFLPFLGEGILSVNGKRWEHSRAMMRPQFAREQISDLELEEIHLQNLLLHMPTDSSGWTSPVDLQPPFYRLTLDSATEFLFGESVDSQLATLPQGQRPLSYNGKSKRWTDFGELWERCTAYVMIGISLENLSWTIDYVPKVHAAFKEVHIFADYYVSRALSNSEPNVKKLEKGHRKQKFVFLDAIIEQTKDPIVLRTELLNLLIAGRDTTGGLLGFLFHVLAKKPAYYDKLRAVVLEEFGTYNSPKEITFSSLKGCKYLQWCLKETLRVHHVVPINSRTALKNTTLPRGGGPDGKSPVYIKKGQSIWWASNVMQTRKDIWGPDADEFKPERWDGKTTGWEYIPFSGGPRICVGQQFSLTEASYVIVRLLQRFDKIESLDKDDVTRYDMKMTCAAETVNVRMHQAPEV